MPPDRGCCRVLLDELGGLAQEGPIDVDPWVERLAHDGVDTHDGVVVVEVRTQESVGRDDLEEVLQLGDELLECGPLVLVAEVLDDGLDFLVGVEPSPDAR